MKRFITILAICASILITASFAIAEEAMLDRIGIDVAFQDPGEEYTAPVYSWNVRTQSFLTKDLSLDFRTGYMTGVSDRVDEIIDVNIIPLEVGLTKYSNINSKSRFYIGGGIGRYLFYEHNRLRDYGLTIKVDDTTGAYGKCGFESNAGQNVSLFVEMRYTYLKPEAKAYFYGHKIAEDEADLSGLGGSIGIMYRF